MSLAVPMLASPCMLAWHCMSLYAGLAGAIRLNQCLVQSPYAQHNLFGKSLPGGCYDFIK